VLQAPVLLRQCAARELTCRGVLHGSCRHFNGLIRPYGPCGSGRLCGECCAAGGMAVRRCWRHEIRVWRLWRQPAAAACGVWFQAHPSSRVSWVTARKLRQLSPYAHPSSLQDQGVPTEVWDSVESSGED
jgi:hypothetical protein